LVEPLSLRAFAQNLGALSIITVPTNSANDTNQFLKRHFEVFTGRFCLDRTFIVADANDRVWSANARKSWLGWPLPLDPSRHQCGNQEGIQNQQLISPLLSGPIPILELATKEEWKGEEAQARGDHRQAA
jgi:hypothetical protein